MARPSSDRPSSFFTCVLLITARPISGADSDVVVASSAFDDVGGCDVGLSGYSSSISSFAARIRFTVAKTLSAVRVEAAADLGVVLAPRDTPNEQLRGLREGWVHWFVGAPIVHAESGEHFAFDEEVGRIVLA